jgi:hypothetical protein
VAESEVDGRSALQITRILMTISSRVNGFKEPLRYSLQATVARRLDLE